MNSKLQRAIAKITAKIEVGKLTPEQMEIATALFFLELERRNGEINQADYQKQIGYLTS